MSLHHPFDPLDGPASRPARARAWLLSLVVHLSMALLASLFLWDGRERGSRDGATSGIARPGNIVLVRRDMGEVHYFSETSQQRHEVFRPAIRGVDSVVDSDTASDRGKRSLSPADSPPPTLAGVALPDVAGDLPLGEGLVGAPQLETKRGNPHIPGRLDEAAVLAEDALLPREVLPTGPTAQVALFGSSAAVGRSFVFVIDRSQSMGSTGLGAIQAAAKELSSHIDGLTPEQTFQVLAYNQAIAWFTDRELIAATESNKRHLVRFVANIAAYGQTEHLHALIAALRLKPEVIFLLTDGGDPEPNPGQLRLVHELSGGRTSIHCIHFGRGPKPESPSFLVRLAAENHGSYVYLDMNTR